MLIKTMTKNVSDSMAGTQDDARVLSLAETVGNMGHWYWHIQSGVMSWYDQVFCIFGRDPDTHEPTFDSFMGAVYGAILRRPGLALSIEEVPVP